MSRCHLCGGEGDILGVRLADAEIERDHYRNALERIASRNGLEDSTERDPYVIAQEALRDDK